MRTPPNPCTNADGSCANAAGANARQIAIATPIRQQLRIEVTGQARLAH
jgi:hypothetical protein